MPNKKQIEKLKRQVARYEAKGMYDTAAHIMLERLLKSEKGVTLEAPAEVKQEKQKHGK